MTKREAAIVSAYTGVMIGSFRDMDAYVKEVMNDPFLTAVAYTMPVFVDHLREASKADFLALEIR